MRTIRLILIFAAWMGGAASAGAAAKDPPYNIVLISVDGLRADHLSFHGYGRKTSPRISARIGEAVMSEATKKTTNMNSPTIR